MGAQLRVYRQKIRSAQTTKKITKAMELIAASRIQKAMGRVTASTPYSRAITRAVSAVATYSNVDHVLTTEPETIERAAVVILTSDRGLAGAFNSQVLREAEELAELLRSQGKEVVYFLVGRKAVGYFQFRRRASEQQWTGSSENPEFELAKEIADAGGVGLHVMCVLEPSLPWASYPSSVHDWSAEAEVVRERTRATVDELVARLGAGVTGEVLEGAPVRELLFEAGTLGLLVCGSRSYGPVRRLLLGSTSRRLVHEAPVPVLVLPRGAAHDEAAADEASLAARTS